MTPREQAAFNAGLVHAAEMARIAAVTIETRDDAGHIRQQAAIAALRGLAEGLKLTVGDYTAQHTPETAPGDRT